jgi:hypothetical protein
MNFPDAATEIAYLTDLQQHYQQKADELMKKEYFRKQDIEYVQAYSSLAESAKEVAELIKGGV